MVKNGNIPGSKWTGSGVSRERKRRMERLARVEGKIPPRYYYVVVRKSPSMLSVEPNKMVGRA